MDKNTFIERLEHVIKPVYESAHMSGLRSGVTMAVKIYNKLVRDKNPELLKQMEKHVKQRYFLMKNI